MVLLSEIINHDASNMLVFDTQERITYAKIMLAGVEVGDLSTIVLQYLALPLFVDNSLKHERERELHCGLYIMSHIKTQNAPLSVEQLAQVRAQVGPPPRYPGLCKLGLLPRPLPQRSLVMLQLALTPDQKFDDFLITSHQAQLLFCLVMLVITTKNADGSRNCPPSTPFMCKYFCSLFGWTNHPWREAPPFSPKPARHSLDRIKQVVAQAMPAVQPEGLLDTVFLMPKMRDPPER